MKRFQLPVFLVNAVRLTDANVVEPHITLTPSMTLSIHAEEHDEEKSNEIEIGIRKQLPISTIIIGLLVSLPVASRGGAEGASRPE